MKYEVSPVTGQKIDRKEHSDNAPASYSSPSSRYKLALKVHAAPNCPKCSGTGYIGKYKALEGGRCFECLPDRLWNDMRGECVLIGTDDVTGEIKCHIRRVASGVYPKGGYIVTPPDEHPPLIPAIIFSTEEEACRYASAEYGI